MPESTHSSTPGGPGAGAEADDSCLSTGLVYGCAFPMAGLSVLVAVGLVVGTFFAVDQTMSMLAGLGTFLGGMVCFAGFMYLAYWIYSWGYDELWGPQEARDEPLGDTTGANSDATEPDREPSKETRVAADSPDRVEQLEVVRKRIRRMWRNGMVEQATVDRLFALLSELVYLRWNRT
ncbi:MAG: hypothetical protein ABEN55_08820, partial [Bradymonadaceae bacterium]